MFARAFEVALYQWFWFENPFCAVPLLRASYVCESWCLLSVFLLNGANAANRMFRICRVQCWRDHWQRKLSAKTPVLHLSNCPPPVEDTLWNTMHARALHYSRDYQFGNWYAVKLSNILPDVSCLSCWQNSLSNASSPEYELTIDLLD